MPAVQETVDQVRRIDVDQYKYGFETLIESDKAPKGLSEDTVRFISAKKNEPDWMLAWRLDAYKRWLTMREPKWAKVEYGPIDYQNIYYYSAPKRAPQSLDEIDPEILRTYEKLGIPLREREALLGIQKAAGENTENTEGEGGNGGNGYGRVAVDAVFDSVSVATTFKAELAKAGVLFMPISEAIHEHPELVKKYLGTVVPISDNFFATLNSAVFSDGSFVYVPPGVRCPMELSTYFRINERNTGQFERTLIIADKGSYVSYLEGCTAPMRDENQLHAAVVELIALDDAEIKYSTIQNWYPGDANGRGGVYNFVTKRGDCRGNNAKIHPRSLTASGGQYRVQETVDQSADRRRSYKYGFETLIDPKGAQRPSEDTVRFISAKKNEPDGCWLAARRLPALADDARAEMGQGRYGPIDYQDIYYYSAPKKAPQSLDEIDPEILRTYEKLGIPLREREALLGIQKADGEKTEDADRRRRAATAMAASPSTRCSIRCRSRPPSRPSSPRSASSSCRSRRRSTSIPSW